MNVFENNMIFNNDTWETLQYSLIENLFIGINKNYIK